MNKRFQQVMTLSFIVYIGGFFVWQFLGEDKTFSPLENRNLAQMPKITQETFLSGAFGEDFEKYIADQFPGRDTFIAMKAQTERVLQKKDNNGVYIGADDHFLQMFDTPDMEMAAKNVNYINTFAENFNLHFMLVPTATKIHEDKLPPFATPYDEKVFADYFQEGFSDDVKWVDAYHTLQAHADESIYYKTDHHWTTLGAYYGYTAFCESYGIEPLALADFERIPSGGPFYGSLFSKGNFTFATPDTLEIFEHKNPVTVTLDYPMSEKTSESLYDLSFLEEKDKYSVFLGGNDPLVTIETSVQNGKKLVVIKDSYANAMLPFLVHHFETIHVLDLRFVNMSIADYMREHDMTDVLMLYNIQNFEAVTKLSVLKQ